MKGLEAKRDPYQLLVEGMLRMLGIGMELYLFNVYIPQMTPAPVENVRCAKRRRRSTYIEVLASLRKAREIGGSSNVVTRAAVGRKDLDCLVSTSTCLIHRERMKAAFAGATTLTAQWDPGSYSGKSWHMGLLATLRVPPSAPRRPETWRRRFVGRSKI